MKTNWLLSVPSAIVSALFNYSFVLSAPEPVADIGTSVGWPFKFYGISGIVPVGMVSFFPLFLNLVIIFSLVFVVLNAIGWGLASLFKKRLA